MRIPNERAGQDTAPLCRRPARSATYWQTGTATTRTARTMDAIRRRPAGSRRKISNGDGSATTPGFTRSSVLHTYGKMRTDFHSELLNRQSVVLETVIIITQKSNEAPSHVRLGWRLDPHLAMQKSCLNSLFTLCTSQTSIHHRGHTVLIPVSHCHFNPV